MLVGTYRGGEVGRGHPLRELLAEQRRQQRLDVRRLEGLTQQETDALVKTRHRRAGGRPRHRAVGADGRQPAVHRGDAPVAGRERRPAEPVTARTLEEMGVAEGVKAVILRRLDALAPRAAGGAARRGRDRPRLRPRAGGRRRPALARRGGRGLRRAGDGRPRRGARGVPLRVRPRDRAAWRSTRTSAGRAGRSCTSASARCWRRSRARPARRRRSRTTSRAAAAIPPGSSATRCAPARRPSRACAYEEAAGHFERAADALGRLGPEEESRRAEVLLLWASVLSRAGRSSQASEKFRAAAASARARGDAEQLAHAALGIGQRYWEANVNDPAYRGQLEEALERLATVEDSRRVRRLSARLSSLLAEHLTFVPGEDEHARELSARALATAKELGEPDTLITALMARHVTLLHVEHVDERLELIEEVLDLRGRHRELAALGAPVAPLRPLRARPDRRRARGGAPAARALARAPAAALPAHRGGLGGRVRGAGRRRRRDRAAGRRVVRARHARPGLRRAQHPRREAVRALPLAGPPGRAARGRRGPRPWPHRDLRLARGALPAPGPHRPRSTRAAATRARWPPASTSSRATSSGSAPRRCWPRPSPCAATPRRPRPCTTR